MYSIHISINFIFRGDFMARVQISIDDDVLKRVDEFSKKSALSRSAFLSMEIGRASCRERV